MEKLEIEDEVVDDSDVEVFFEKEPCDDCGGSGEIFIPATLDDSGLVVDEIVKPCHCQNKPQSEEDFSEGTYE